MQKYIKIQKIVQGIMWYDEGKKNMTFQRDKVMKGVLQYTTLGKSYYKR